MSRRSELHGPGVDRGRGRGDRGAALLEFVLVAPLLILFLYGIAAYGMALAVKHSVTQAAADGARAAVPTPQDPNEAGPIAAATGQANTDLQWLVGQGQSACSQPAFSCSATVSPCPVVTGTSTTTTGECLTMKVTYDYQHYPVIPSLPGLGLILPDRLPSSTTTLLTGPPVAS